LEVDFGLIVQEFAGSKEKAEKQEE
jgi:hypothetical protein